MIYLMCAWEILWSGNDSKNMPRKSHLCSCLSCPRVDHFVTTKKDFNVGIGCSLKIEIISSTFGVKYESIS